MKDEVSIHNVSTGSSSLRRFILICSGGRAMAAAVRQLCDLGGQLLSGVGAGTSRACVGESGCSSTWHWPMAPEAV